MLSFLSAKDGVLHPLEALPLEENLRVTLTIRACVCHDADNAVHPLPAYASFLHLLPLYASGAPRGAGPAIIASQAFLRPHCHVMLPLTATLWEKAHRHRDCSNVATFSDKIHFGPNGPRAAVDGRN